MPPGRVLHGRPWRSASWITRTIILATGLSLALRALSLLVASPLHTSATRNRGTQQTASSIRLQNTSYEYGGLEQSSVVSSTALDQHGFGRAELKPPAAHNGSKQANNGDRGVVYGAFDGFSDVSALLETPVSIVLAKTALHRPVKFGCAGSQVVKLGGYHELREVEGLFQLLPKTDRFGSKRSIELRPQRTCAVVGNSGSLLEHEYGLEIDRHSVIIRFNAAPTVDFEMFAGSRTTIRVVNNPEGQLPPEVRETKEVLLYTVRSVQQAVEYVRAMHSRRGSWRNEVMVLDPDLLCHAWDWVEQSGDKPSSGLLGVVLALKLCRQVDIYGFHSDTYFNRLTRPHYFDWERPRKGRENIHPFLGEASLYRRLQLLGILRIH